MYPHAVRRGGTEGNIILYIGKSGRTKKLPGDLYASYPQTGDLTWWTPLDRYKETGEKKGGGCIESRRCEKERRKDISKIISRIFPILLMEYFETVS